MNENVTELVLVTLRNEVEEGKRFSNEEKDPMTSKELNEEPFHPLYRVDMPLLALSTSANRTVFSGPPGSIALDRECGHQSNRIGLMPKKTGEKGLVMCSCVLVIKDCHHQRTENRSFDPPRTYSRLSNVASDLVGADAEGSPTLDRKGFRSKLSNLFRSHFRIRFPIRLIFDIPNRGGSKLGLPTSLVTERGEGLRSLNSS
ncbi:hypothetical protein RND71_036912 [Anisodus tanguticus]|uniref:Uncharacterized protein n=1 Tax=Anisodus tanguticus TaxID=243964 RepID=A0AAE1R2R0_9SOLA|nr:hypothetical protein RND71_036912 [Anisodus tanguticus]